MSQKTLSKQERLCGRTAIARLFAEGKTSVFFPLRVQHLFFPSDKEAFNTQIMVVVPKRNHKKAVIRNRLKRRMRESYRLNKHLLLGTEKLPKGRLQVSLVYLTKEELSFEQINHKILLILSYLASCVKEGF